MIAKIILPLSRFGLALCAALAAPSAAWAVSTSISATASQSVPFISDTIVPNARTVVNTLTASDSFTTNPAIVTASHAKAFATAKVNTITGVVTKATGGLGWVDAVVPTHDLRANAWSSYASGTQLIANGAAGQLVPFQFFIPGTGSALIPAADYGIPAAQAGEPASLALSPQSLLSNANGQATLPSFFDLFIEVRASVHQGALNQELFNGTLTYRDPTSVGGGDFYIPTGDFVGVVPNILIGPDGTVHVNFDDYAGPHVDLLSNTPFDLKMDLYMTAGGPHAAPAPGSTAIPPLALPPGESFPGQTDAIGAGGSFLTSFLLQDHAFNLAPVVTGPVWAVDASGNWSDASNWNPNEPDGVDAVANFTLNTTSPVTVTVDAPKTVGTMNFHNANGYTIAGSNAITLDAAGGGAAINVTLGDHTINAPLTLADDANFFITNGSITINGILDNSFGHTLNKAGAGALTINGPQVHGAGAALNVSSGAVDLNSDGGTNLSLNISGGVTNLNATSHLGQMNVTGGVTNLNATQHIAAINVSGGVLALAAAAGPAPPPYTPGDKRIMTNSLSISGGTLDIGNGAMVVSYAGASPRPAITAMAAAAFDSGAWDLPGLTSSVAAGDLTGLTALGVLDNADFDWSGITGAQFNGSGAGDPVPLNSILVKYTYYGDADLDGHVTTDDFFSWSFGYSNGLTGWQNGDFDYNGIVNTDDFFTWSFSFNNQDMTLSAPGGPVAVPEPSSLVLLVLGAIALGWRPGRRGRQSG